MLKVAAGRGMARQLLPKLFASVFYVHNAFFGRPSDINIVAWSLEIEVQFYLLAPPFALIFKLQSACYPLRISVYERRRENDWYWVEWIIRWLSMLLYIAAFHGM